jgi:Holliday junction resolvasome RuvABC endonuclease subunit
MTLQYDPVELKAAVRRTPAKGRGGPLTRADLREGIVLALDQTIGHTGLVALEHTEHYLRVVDTKTIRTDPVEGAEGYEDTIQRAAMLAEALTPIFQRVAFYFPGGEVVHEAPPVGGKFNRPESALLAAYAVRQAARAASLAVRPMVYPREHKKLVTGSANAGKPQVATAFPLLLAELEVQNFPTRTNEHVRDAMCVALTDLWRRLP